MEAAGFVSLVLSDINTVGATEFITGIDIQPIASITNTTATAEVQKSTADITFVNNDVYTFNPGGGIAAITATLITSTDIAGLVTDLNTAAPVNTVNFTNDGNKLIATYENTAVIGDVSMGSLVKDVGGTPVTQAFEETTEGANSGTLNFATDEDHIFEPISEDVTVALAYGTGDKSVTVTSWVESEAAADYETVDAAYASLPQTITWYDPKGVVVVPRVERIDGNLNDDTGGNMVATIEFNKPINLEMFNRAEWTVDITTGELPTFANDIDLVDEIDVAGYGAAAVNADNFGRYVFVTDQAIGAGTTYTVNVHSELAEEATGVERWFSSTGYSISEGYTVATDVEMLPAITDTADVDFDGAAGTGTTFATASIRAGVKAVTYEAELTAANGDELEVASVPMLAVITNGSFMPTGSSISVSGNAVAMTAANQVRHVTGFSDADGDFRVTVTSAVANKNESYIVEFYVLNNGNFENDGLAGETSRIEASYTAADAGATSLTAVNSVVAGEEVTVSFTITDQFGEAISATAAGKALSISLAAPSTDNLNESEAVPASGEVSFSFTNYLTVGGSDLLTATLYTGTASDPTVVDTAVVTLYNTGATGAIQVPETLTGVITYVDFVPNGEKVSAANPDPVNDIVFTGTIVDANGVGIPAAVVTISAPGMQIQDGTRYYNDTRTTNADAAGVFSVNLNAHIVNTTGATVTATTADGKTASTLVKTYLPSGAGNIVGDNATLNGNNLQLTVDMPANIVMNQTYAVTAKLTDKWGNPVKTSDNAVDFLGTGSIQVNGQNIVVPKDFDKNGEALVYIRSVKDIAGPGTLDVTIEDADYTSFNGTAVLTTTVLDFGTQATTDVVTTDWNETLFESSFSKVVEVLESAADIVTAQKVNAGSFKGYVALYAKGYEGQRMSAKVGNDWVIVPSVPAATNDLFRAVEFVGAGVDISVRIYIDRVLVATIPLLTK
jgi:protocatechuate 3,4-dioxygenase beta subunit